MSEKELIQALRTVIDRHSPPAPEPSLVARLRREAWRLHFLGGISMLLCCVGIVGIIVVFWWMNRYFVMSSMSHLGLGGPDIQAQIFQAQRELHHSLEAAMACLAAFMLGLLCTIWLISSSRRATLSQINLSLLRLTEEMKRLQKPHGEPAAEVQEPMTTANSEMSASEPPKAKGMRSNAFWAMLILGAIALLSIPEVQANLAWLIRHVGIFIRHIVIRLNLF
jgi:hypothetical protein